MKFLSRRINTPEIMDTEECSDQEMEQVLNFLKWTNIYCGGNAVLLKHLSNFSRKWKKEHTIRVLDVGCGLGDIAHAVTQWAMRQGWTVEVTALDLQSQIIRIAKKKYGCRPRIYFECADVFS